MSIEIPNQGLIRQIGRSDTEGELYETFSLDINNPYGKIKASKKLVKVLDETDFSNDRVQALAVYKKSNAITATKYYAISNGAVLTCGVGNDPTDSANWSEETGIVTTGFGDSTDAVVFDDLLLISRSTNILSWDDTSDDNDWWTTVSKGGETGPALTTGYPHTMHVHRGGQETLFVTDANKVHYANTTAGHSTVTLGTDQIACCVTSGVNAIWVGTYSESSDNAYVYEIHVGEELDATPIARNAFKVDGRSVLSIEVLDNIPYIITERGNLQAFNGAGFTTVATLPFSGTQTVLINSRVGAVEADNNERPIHPKGMRAHNDSLYISVNSETEGTGFSQDPYATRTPSGIWEYNARTRQLHHRYAFSNSESDKGAKLLDYTGPVMVTDTPYTFLMAGAEIDGTTAGLFAEGDSSYGYFVTPEDIADGETDSYLATHIKANEPDGSDSICLKYRTAKKPTQFADVTLVSGTEINTTDTLTVTEGDEVTFIAGEVVGQVAHVVSVSTSDTVTSITLDESVGSEGDSAQIEIQNFSKDAEQYTSANGTHKRWGSDTVSTKMQQKVELDGDIEIQEFISKSKFKTKV